MRCAQMLIDRGTTPVIPNAPYRKRLHPFDRDAYKRRNLVERAFCRLKDFRRVPPDTTNSPQPTPPPSASQLSSLGGYES